MAQISLHSKKNSFFKKQKKVENIQNRYKAQDPGFVSPPCKEMK